MVNRILVQYQPPELNAATVMATSVIARIMSLIEKRKLNPVELEECPETRKTDRTRIRKETFSLQNQIKKGISNQSRPTSDSIARWVHKTQMHRGVAN